MINSINGVRGVFRDFIFPTHFDLDDEVEYKPWRKLVRISGRLARVYERQTGVSTFLFADQLEGRATERAYVDLEGDVPLKYEAAGQLSGKVEGKAATIKYEIGFEVVSLGKPIDIDWSFIANP
ncbi:MAG: hypothetical protein RMK32_03985 [Anaerolineae bacterium]|nr:hypothetical protein [Thermoflexus sp.]MDW8064772.1 hypothetical protein [Anaerolineae bacterium]